MLFRQAFASLAGEVVTTERGKHYIELEQNIRAAKQFQEDARQNIPVGFFFRRSRRDALCRHVQILNGFPLAVDLLNVAIGLPKAFLCQPFLVGGRKRGEPFAVFFLVFALQSGAMLPT